MKGLSPSRFDAFKGALAGFVRNLMPRKSSCGFIGVQPGSNETSYIKDRCTNNRSERIGLVIALSQQISMSRLSDWGI